MKQETYRGYEKNWPVHIVINYSGGNLKYNQWIENFAIDKIVYGNWLGMSINENIPYDRRMLDYLGIHDDNNRITRRIFSFKDDRDATMFALKFGDKII